MVSDRKRIANQENAKKSTGPSDTGRTRLNALRHGMSAGFLSKEALIDGGPGKEDPEELEALSKAFRDYWKPEGLPEELEVDELVTLTWQARRIVRHEATAIRDSQERAFADGRGAVHGTEMDEDDANAPDEETPKFGKALDLDLAAMKTSDPLRSVPHLAVLAMGRAESVYKVPIKKLLSLRKDWRDYEEISLPQVRKVIQAACQKREISEQDFWAGIWQPFEHDSDVLKNDPDNSWFRVALGKTSGAQPPDGRPQTAEERQQRIPSLPSAKVLDKVQRYGTGTSRSYDRALRRLLAMQAVRRQTRELDPDNRRRARPDDGGSARRGGTAL